MRTGRRKLDEFLWITHLNSFVRSIYSSTSTAGREARKAQSKMKGFYGQFVGSGNLVFDIGANAGIMAATFASLGAKVIALEPNGDCVRHIQLNYPNQGIQVIQA